MEKRLTVTATVDCVCGQVAIEARGAPIACVICHCDDCQEGSRQIGALPNAASIEEPEGGTAYLAYRKDRVRCLRGAALLKPFKIRESSATSRMIASCCNTALFLGFDDAKHWVDLYRSRSAGEVVPVQIHICTKSKPEACTIAPDVPQHPRYPASLLMKLLVARLAMVFHR